MSTWLQSPCSIHHTGAASFDLLVSLRLTACLGAAILPTQVGFLSWLYHSSPGWDSTFISTVSFTLVLRRLAPQDVGGCVHTT